MYMKRVGASLLAKIVTDDAGILDERVALGFFASKLAPAGDSFCGGNRL